MNFSVIFKTNLSCKLDLNVDDFFLHERKNSHVLLVVVNCNLFDVCLSKCSTWCVFVLKILYRWCSVELLKFVWFLTSKRSMSEISDLIGQVVHIHFCYTYMVVDIWKISRKVCLPRSEVAQSAFFLLYNSLANDS